MAIRFDRSTRSLIRGGIGILLAFAVAGSARAQSSTPQAAIVELSGVAVRLNESGDIAGAVDVGPDTHAAVQHVHAAIYRNSAWQDLGVPAGDQQSALVGISNAGAVAGYSFYTNGVPFPNTDNRWRAIWAPAGATSVELLDGLTPDNFVLAINDSNVIVGCRNRNDDDYPDPHHAFVYANGSITALHDILNPPATQTGLEYSCAQDVNDAGDVVGYTQPYGSEQRGFLYRNGVVTTLEQGTSRLFEGKAINNGGQIVGQGYIDGFNQVQGVVYDIATATISSLGLESTSLYSSPYGVNSLGDVVGYMYVGADWEHAVRHAFLASGGQVYDLNDLVPAGGEWVLQDALSINTQGQIVADGYLTSSPAITRSYLLTVAYDPLQRAAGLIDAVAALKAAGVLNGGNANALVVKLQHAINKLQLGDAAGAAEGLQAFISQVQVFIGSGKLTPAQGQPLIAAAQRIIAEITS